MEKISSTLTTIRPNRIVLYGYMMGNRLSLEEWQKAYQEDHNKVRRQIQTLLTLYRNTGEKDKLKAVKDIWLALISKEIEDGTRMDHEDGK